MTNEKTSPRLNPGISPGEIAIAFAANSRSNALLSLQSGVINLKTYYQLHPEPKEVAKND